MVEHRLDEIEGEMGALVQVSTLESNESDDVGWVDLRIIVEGHTISILLEPGRARELAESLRETRGASLERESKGSWTGPRRAI